MGISSISHARTLGDPRRTVFHVELVLLRRFVGSARGEAQFVVFQARCLVPRPARYLRAGTWAVAVSSMIPQASQAPYSLIELVRPEAQITTDGIR